jgi:hypothetical protein
VYGYCSRQKLGFSLGKYAMVFQAEVYTIKACTVDNLDTVYRNRNKTVKLENASLNTGANCNRYVCTVLHNVMQFQSRQLFMHKTYIKIYGKIFSFLQAP